MIYIAGASCDEACNHSLFNMRQINKAVGKDANRVRHVIIHTSPPDKAFSTLLKNDYPATVHFNARLENLQSAMEAIHPVFTDNAIYLMDPIGNIMMRFKTDLPPKALIHDLTKLLKVSQIG